MCVQSDGYYYYDDDDDDDWRLEDVYARAQLTGGPTDCTCWRKSGGDFVQMDSKSTENQPVFLFMCMLNEKNEKSRGRRTRI